MKIRGRLFGDCSEKKELRKEVEEYLGKWEKAVERVMREMPQAKGEDQIWSTMQKKYRKAESDVEELMKTEVMGEIVSKYRQGKLERRKGVSHIGSGKGNKLILDRVYREMFVQINPTGKEDLYYGEYHPELCVMEIVTSEQGKRFLLNERSKKLESAMIEIEGDDVWIHLEVVYSDAEVGICYDIEEKPFYCEKGLNRPVEEERHLLIMYSGYTLEKANQYILERLTPLPFADPRFND